MSKQIILEKPIVLSCLRQLPLTYYIVKVHSKYDIESEISINNKEFEPIEIANNTVFVTGLNVGDSFQLRFRSIEGENFSDWYIFNKIRIDNVNTNYIQQSPNPQNPNFYDNDFALFDSLQNEVVQKRGIDCIYLPQKFQKFDLILGEDVLTKFEKSYRMKMYLRSSTGFEGNGDMFGKFGLSVEDIANLEVNINEFSRTTDGYIPLEGDLIYIEMGKWLMEIFHVQHEDPYFTLGKRSQYIFNTRKYDYSHEDLDTQVEMVDKLKDYKSTDIISENDLIEDDINSILNSNKPNEFGDK